jgi:hypothetical protein
MGSNGSFHPAWKLGNQHNNMNAPGGLGAEFEAMKDLMKESAILKLLVPLEKESGNPKGLQLIQ